jgi:formylglycine-generating enzyme required for sulfatase activity
MITRYFDYPTGTNAAPGLNIHETTNPGNNGNSDVFVIGRPYYRTVVGEFELSDSPYGTFDQGGNVIEWNETAVTSWSRGLRGGSYFNGSPFMQASFRLRDDPNLELFNVGFRVASIPEPASTALVALSGAALCWRRRAR